MPTVDTVNVAVTANTTKFVGGLRGATKHLAAFAGKVRGLGSSMGAMFAGGAFALAGRAMIKTTADFERSMSRTRALTQATDAEFKKLNKTALELSGATEFTASQVGATMAELGLLGFKANQVIGAMPGVLQLASAGQIDLAEAAGTAAKILRSQGLEVQDLARVNDILTKSFTSSAVDLGQLGEGFKFLGAIGKTAGLQLSEMTAALGMLGNVGIPASQAGTGLKKVIATMLSPVGKAGKILKTLGINTRTAAGAFPSLTDVVRDVERAIAETGDELLVVGKLTEAFGVRAGPTLGALVNVGSKKLADFNDALQNSGGIAEKVSREQLDNLYGTMKILQSQIERLVISFGKAFKPVIQKVAGAISGLVGFLQGLSKEAKTAIVKVTAVAGAISLVLLGITVLSFVLAPLFAAISAAFSLVAGLFTLIVSPVGLAIGVVIAAGYAFYKLAEVAHDAGRDIASAMLVSIDTWAPLMASALRGLIDSWDAFGAGVRGSIAGMLSTVLAVVKAVVNAIWQNSNRVFTLFGTSIPEVIDLWIRFATAIRNVFGKAIEFVGDLVVWWVDLWIDSIKTVVGGLGILVGAFVRIQERIQKTIGKGIDIATDGLEKVGKEAAEQVGKGADALAKALAKGSAGPIEDLITYDPDKMAAEIVGATAAAFNKTSLGKLFAGARGQIVGVEMALRDDMVRAAAKKFGRTLANEPDFATKIAAAMERGGVMAGDLLRDVIGAENFAKIKGWLDDAGASVKDFIDAVRKGAIGVGKGSKGGISAGIQRGASVALQASIVSLFKRLNASPIQRAWRAVGETLEAAFDGFLPSIRKIGTTLSEGFAAAAAGLKGAGFLPGTDEEGQFTSGKVLGGSKIGGTIEAGMQGAQAGGPIGALVAILVDLLMQSKQFAEVMKLLDTIFQAAADTVGAILEPLGPILGALSLMVNAVLDPLGPLLKVVGEAIAPLAPLLVIMASVLQILMSPLSLVTSLLEMLMPLIEGAFWIMFQAIRLTAIGMLQVAKWLGMIINKVVGFIGEIVGWLINLLAKALRAIGLKKAATALEAFADKLKGDILPMDKVDEALQAFRDMTFEGAAGTATDALNSLSEATDAATSSLANAPAGFKIAKARFDATNVGGAATLPWIQGVQQARAVYIENMAVITDDPEKAGEAIVEEADRKSSQDTGNPFSGREQ